MRPLPASTSVPTKAAKFDFNGTRRRHKPAAEALGREQQLSSQQPAQGSPHDGAADGIAHRAGNLLADVAGNLAGNAVDHRARHVAGPSLADHGPFPPRTGRPEHLANRVLNTADPAPDPA